MSDIEESIELAEDGDEDLFGDGGGGDGDGDADEDIELAPSEDERGNDRDGASEAQEGASRDEEGDEKREYKEKLVKIVPMYRHRIPKSKSRLQSLRVPNFIKLNPVEYKADSYEPTPWDLENAKSETPKPVVYYRRDPSTGLLQSNTNLYRWSDGSVTIQIGDEHFDIQRKPLGPPANQPYKQHLDSHYYAAAAHLTTNSLLIVGQFTEQYIIRPNKETQDDAVEKLRLSLAGAAKKNVTDMIITTHEDPELAKKRAEEAERQANRAQRQREAQMARSSGYGRSKGGGGTLSINDLEGGRRGAGIMAVRKRGAPGGGKNKHRRPEYDSDDDIPDGARRGDSYSYDDGFLVNSDEESEEMVDDEDEEETLADEEEERQRRPRAKRQKTAEPQEKNMEASVDADGDEGLAAPSHAAEAVSSRRRRHIIDDDEEEE